MLVDSYYHSSKNLLTIYQTIWLHMPEDSNLQTNLHEKVRSLKIMLTTSMQMFLVALMDRLKLVEVEFDL